MGTELVEEKKAAKVPVRHVRFSCRKTEEIKKAEAETEAEVEIEAEAEVEEPVSRVRSSRRKKDKKIAETEVEVEIEAEVEVEEPVSRVRSSRRKKEKKITRSDRLNVVEKEETVTRSQRSSRRRTVKKDNLDHGTVEPVSTLRKTNKSKIADTPSEPVALRRSCRRH